MPENLLIPSVDLRVGGLLEYNRQQVEKAGKHRHTRQKSCPTITLSREYGCEGYPVAVKLRDLMAAATGDEWLLMDKALLAEVARHHNLSEEVLHGLGKRNRILDEVMATFSSSWKSERDHFKLLCRHIVALAEKGNVIIVGRGSAIITQHLENCHHFRVYASLSFKTASIASRLGIPSNEAEQLIEKCQKQRDTFIIDFLDRDAREPRYYDMLFNNDRTSPERIAWTIAEHVLKA